MDTGIREPAYASNILFFFFLSLFSVFLPLPLVRSAAFDRDPLPCLIMGRSVCSATPPSLAFLSLLFFVLLLSTFFFPRSFRHSLFALFRANARGRAYPAFARGF